MKRLLSILFLLPLWSYAQTSCPAQTITYTFNSAHDSVQLNSSPGYDTYSWTPASGLSNAGIANPMGVVSGPTTYTLTTTSIGPDLVVNGDFAAGNTGFISGQTFSTIYTPCNYYVDSTFFTYSFPGVTDHTPTADNRFMSVDGCTSSTVLWEETIPAIQAASIYKFAFWASRADQVQPIFEIHMIGNVTGDVIEATQVDLPYTGVNMYDEYGLPAWSSGANTSVTIRIINLETNGYGNDFELDDFSFRKICNTSATITINDTTASTDTIVTAALPDSADLSSTFFIPNTFTPNGDGLNDVFAPKFTGLTDFRMLIFDRWGNLIFTTEDMNTGWSGRIKSNADIVQQDTYVYKIYTKNTFGKDHNYIGCINVVK